MSNLKHDLDLLKQDSATKDRAIEDLSGVFALHADCSFKLYHLCQSAQVEVLAERLAERGIDLNTERKMEQVPWTRYQCKMR